MSKNKTKKAESETPEVKAVAPQTKEKGWEPAICPDGVKVMLEKGTRVVSQTEEIARLNKELDEACDERDRMLSDLLRQEERNERLDDELAEARKRNVENERLEDELAESQKRNVEQEERVAKLTAENKYVVTECDKLIERAKGSAEAANKDAARWLAELQDARQNFRFWRFAVIAIAGWGSSAKGDRFALQSGQALDLRYGCLAKEPAPDSAWTALARHCVGFNGLLRPGDSGGAALDAETGELTGIALGQFDAFVDIRGFSSNVGICLDFKDSRDFIERARRLFRQGGAK